MIEDHSPSTINNSMFDHRPTTDIVCRLRNIKQKNNRKLRQKKSTLHTDVYKYIYSYIQTYIHSLIHAHTYLHAYTYIHIQSPMHTFKLINIHAYDLLMYVHIYIHGAYYVCISPYIYMLTHIPVDANILNMDANICIYIHSCLHAYIRTIICMCAYIMCLWFSHD